MTNATNTTNTTLGTPLNFAGIVLQRLCKGNTADAIWLSTHNHLDPFQLVAVSCLLVAVLTLLPLLLSAERKVLDWNGDGKVDGKDLIFCFGKCPGKCCNRKKKQTAVVTPLKSTVTSVPVDAATKITEKPNDDNDLEKGSTDDDTNETGQDKEEDIKDLIRKDFTIIRERVKEGVEEEVSSVIETAKENAEESMESTLADMDPTSTLESGNEDLDALMEEAKESGDPVLQGWLPIVYTLLFLYSAIVYVVYGGVQNVTGTAVDTIFCKSAQIVLIPLFKPATLSLWPAYLPIVQMVYFIHVTVRASRETEKDIEEGKGKLGGTSSDDPKPWMTYAGIISPGEQPFEFNMLTLTHAWMIGFIIIIYLLASLVFLPLVIIFGLFLCTHTLNQGSSYGLEKTNLITYHFGIIT